jgi:hypothetical protein
MKLAKKGQCSNCFVSLPANRKNNYCKECNQELFKERNRMYYVKHREERIVRMREYNKVNGTKNKQTWRAKHPERAIAQAYVAYNLRNGKLTKKPCAVCGSKRVEAHHPDYQKPKEIIWLCRKHHIEIQYSVLSANN